MTKPGANSLMYACVNPPFILRSHSKNSSSFGGCDVDKGKKVPQD